MLLVAAQLALSTIFLIASVLLVRFTDTTLAVDRSQAAGPLVLASIETSDEDYRTAALAASPGVALRCQRRLGRPHLRLAGRYASSSGSSRAP